MEFIENYVMVYCPLTYKNEKVYYRRITETPLLHINGCDNCSGSSTCQNCFEKVREQLASQ